MKLVATKDLDGNTIEQEPVKKEQALVTPTPPRGFKLPSDPYPEECPKGISVNQFYKYWIKRLDLTVSLIVKHASWDGGGAYRLVHEDNPSKEGRASSILKFCVAFNIPFEELHKIKVSALPVSEENYVKPRAPVKYKKNKKA